MNRGSVLTSPTPRTKNGFSAARRAASVAVPEDAKSSRAISPMTSAVPESQAASATFTAATRSG